MIQVSQLTKSFEGFKAVNNIDITVEKGETFGLLGPNGAGKSTTINILSGLLSFDSGTVLFDEKNLLTHQKECKKMIGVVPQEIALYEELSPIENLSFFGSLYNINSNDLKVKIDELLVLVGLSDRKNDAIKTFSGGMKRRINIAVALLHNPKVLFMDEPTVGVDLQSRNRIFEIISTLKKQGITIVYTTHYMEEAERICDRIAIIDEGKIVAVGSKSELKTQNGLRELVQIELEHINDEVYQCIANELPFELKREDNVITIACDKNKDLSGVLTILFANKLSIKEIVFLSPNLEMVFLELTGKQLRD